MPSALLFSAMLACSLGWQSGPEREVTGVILDGHKGPVYGLAFAPDGRTLASGSLDRTVRLWGVASRTERFVIRSFEYPVLSLAYSPDGKRFVTGGGHYANDKDAPENAAELKVWDTSHDLVIRPAATLQGHTAEVRTVAFAPDGRTIASGGWDDLIMLWDAETGRQRAVLKGHTSLIVALSFAPDSKTLASAGGDGTVRLWDVETGRERETYEVGGGIVYGVAFSPVGRALAACNSGSLVTLWDAETGKRRSRLQGDGGALLALAWAPDGATLATSSGSGSVLLWNPEAETLRFSIGEPDSIWGMAFSPDGTRLATGSQDRDGYLKLWDLSRALDREPGER